MRLDKFLKVSRLIKRRAVAKEVIDHERVIVNGQVAKPSKEIQVGDILVLSLGAKEVTVRILNIVDTALKNNASEMYEIISIKVLNSNLPS